MLIYKEICLCLKSDLLEKTISLFSDSSVDIGSAVCELSDEEMIDKNIVKAKANLNKDGIGVAEDFRRQIKIKKIFIIT